MAAKTLTNGGTVADIDGLALDVPRLEDGAAAYLSPQMFVPREAIRVMCAIRATPVAGTPTVVVKIRQDIDSANAEGVDRAITSPTAFEAFAAAAKALVNDDVVGTCFQIEMSCTGGACDIEAVAAAR